MNDKIRTGRVELVATKIEILNKADKLPFYSHEHPGEDVRLKYRYLDLRNPDMLNLPGKIQADAADALAVAICHGHVRATANRIGIASRDAWRRK